MDPFQNSLYHFEEFNEQIFAQYDPQGLQNLSQVKRGHGDLDSLLHDVLRKKTPIHPLPYSLFKLQDEMNCITRDIKYITGVLFYLRPYIIDTDETNGRYNQNLADRRYLMYANFGLQSIYNFWDRIGDMLHLYFETGLPVGNVYLGRVLNNIKPKDKLNQYFIDLESLYDNELKGFIDERNNTVHHYQLESQFYWGAIEQHQNLSEKSRLNADKHAFPEKFKHHLELCFKGFELALLLLDTLPDDPNIPVQPYHSS
ncbi:Cthe_2314 family HEPN domain-containing protein [Hymenobacter actinosclerus]|uniref:Cthe-2314-like HEPN domain-containing protein n=1 Tax=Hymenobacter actinosclerus TaxID=82805 RepID=A0A1I0IQK1_9BACT|nr:Cthe_2314 family HEPN domain-containing protein [Hymenobacter actinosclerus]SET99368.1 hypothetical protein SAMN04487998_3447 [Hymenobacter actinosclerus]